MGWKVRVRFPTEETNFSLISYRPDCLCRAHSTSYSLYIGIQNEWCYALLRICVDIRWTVELYLTVWKLQLTEVAFVPGCEFSVTFQWQMTTLS
jgi:hypothetical protein